MSDPNPNPGLSGKTFETCEYSQTDNAPYRIFAELEDDKQGTCKINKLTLGKILSATKDYKTNVINMRPLGQKKVLIFVKNYEVANRMQKDQRLKGLNYKLYVPRSFISVTGVVAGVPTDMTLAEIKENMQCQIPILDVRRLHRFVDNVKTPSNRISVTFRASKLPEEVKLYCCLNKVLAFINKPVICHNCLRYGHKTDSCRSRKRCSVCANQHEDMGNGDCPNPKKCMYCKTAHRTTDSECPEWTRQRNIKTIMSKTNLTYMEARELNPVLTQNRYEILENVDEFPTPVDSFADMVAGSFKTKNPIQYRPPRNKRTLQQEDVNIADKIQVFADKKKKTDQEGEQNGVALFNKYRVTDFDRWAKRFEQLRQQNISQQLGAAGMDVAESTNEKIITSDMPSSSQPGTLVGWPALMDELENEKL